MWRFPDLSRRTVESELMDDPSLDRREHQKALAGLARLNRLGDSAGMLWDELRDVAAMPGHGRFSVLDVATGSGDVPVGLASRARKAGVALDIHACDISEYALSEARRRATQAGFDLATFPLDAVRQQIPGEYDVVMCSLFTHHLAEESVVEVLYKMKAAARKMVLVNDLSRSRGTYALAVGAAHVLSRSRVVHVDAALSVCAAFTVGEMESLAERAGLKGANVRLCRPARMLLTWRRD